MEGRGEWRWMMPACHAMDGRGDAWAGADLFLLLLSHADLVCCMLIFSSSLFPGLLAPSVGSAACFSRLPLTLIWEPGQVTSRHLA